MLRAPLLASTIAALAFIALAGLPAHAADEKAKKAAEKAPTTKTEMGKRFKSGGVTRADGCITKGGTKGRIV